MALDGSIAMQRCWQGDSKARNAPSAPVAPPVPVLCMTHAVLMLLQRLVLAWVRLAEAVPLHAMYQSMLGHAVLIWEAVLQYAAYWTVSCCVLCHGGMQLRHYH